MIHSISLVLVCVGLFFAYRFVSEAEILSTILLSHEADVEIKRRLEVIESNSGIATHILFFSFVFLLNLVAQLIARWFKMKRKENRGSLSENAQI